MMHVTSPLMRADTLWGESGHSTRVSPQMGAREEPHGEHIGDRDLGPLT